MHVNLWVETLSESLDHFLATLLLDMDIRDKERYPFKIAAPWDIGVKNGIKTQYMV